MSDDDAAGAARRTRGPSTDKTTRTRATLVAAARDVFLEQGYSATRISDVARQAHVATGTVYRYFDAKEALFEEVLREAIAEPVASMQAAIDAEGGDIGAALHQLLLPLAREFRDGYRGALARIVVAESVRFPALAETYRRIAVLPLLDQVRAMAVEAVARGQMVSDALVRFPQLMLAAMVLIALENIFGSEAAVDVEGLFDAHLSILFGHTQNSATTGEGGIARPPGPSV